MKHLRVLVMVGGSLLAYSQTTKPVAGEIKGTVVDQNGSSISAATVYAVPQDLGLDDITPPSVKSNSSGQFDFRGGLPLGSYKLYARKDSDSYPNPFDAFYADTKADTPKVELTAGHPAATTSVKLRRKAGVITGRVIDAATGAPVEASLSFLDGEGHGHSVLVDGNYRIVVPSGKDVTLMVTRLGSPPESAHRPVAPLRLEPGQFIYMDLPISR
jgi:hypothetical protein